jgi:hypothetical protein
VGGALFRGLKPPENPEERARARAKEEADPCGMTTRKARAKTRATTTARAKTTTRATAKARAMTTARVTTTARATTGVLRCAQDDGRKSKGKSNSNNQYRDLSTTRDDKAVPLRSR